MKIENTLKSTQTTAVKGPKATKGGAPASGARASTVRDSVDITSQGALMQQLESELGALDTSDPAKIEAIRGAIADGSFKVDEEAVADGLIQETIENLSHRHRQ